jgi:hypothetical protein
MLSNSEESRQEGTDKNGNTVRLGDTTSEGSYVGFIDAEGMDWESREEYDISVSSNALFDAVIKWNKAGGLVGKRPDYAKILHDIGSDPELDEQVMEVFFLKVGLAQAYSQPRLSQQAQFN